MNDRAPTGPFVPPFLPRHRPGFGPSSSAESEKSIGPGWNDTGKPQGNTDSKIKYYIRKSYLEFKDHKTKQALQTFDGMLIEFSIDLTESPWVLQIIDDTLRRIDAQYIKTFKTFLKQHLRQTHQLHSQLPQHGTAQSEHISALLQSMHERISLLESKVM